MPAIHKRLQSVYVENMDALECIKRYASEKSLVYADPPYVISTRNEPKAYKHEYTDEQHRQLVETLLSVPGHKILSGYASPIYQPLLDAGWTLERRRFTCNVSHEKGDRTECLYCSPVGS
jgi:DNA adenine methylase